MEGQEEKSEPPACAKMEQRSRKKVFRKERERKRATKTQAMKTKEMLGLCRGFSGKWSGKRDLNPRLQPWQGCTLPLSYSRSMVRLCTRNGRGSQEKNRGSGRRIFLLASVFGKIPLNPSLRKGDFIGKCAVECLAFSGGTAKAGLEGFSRRRKAMAAMRLRVSSAGPVERGGGGSEGFPLRSVR